MIKFDLLLKRMWTVLAVLFCTVVSAQAAAITYQLTTHVDGRTITATANLNAGDNLNDKMPQDLWRGYTTYKYYSDADLTQEITEAPADGGTVYVDYEFDPPFLMSNDSKTVWNYLRNYNGGGSTNRYVYYNKSRNRIDSQDNTSVNSNKKIQWAFYGDGYSFNIKVNDSSISNPWLVWSTTATGNIINGYYYYLTLGSKPEVGWQIYANAATNFKRPGGTVSFGRPDNKDLAYLDDGGLDMRTEAIKTDQHHFDSHNQLVANHTGSSSQATIERNALWWYAFFASPVTSYPNTQDIWHVTYKILGADGTWYDDIVLQKRANNLTPTWPVPGFTPKEGCEYDYFYDDASFSEKFVGAMPNDCNTTLYIMEKEINYISEPWKTLVLPFAIDDLAEYFGADYEGVPSVNVSELQDVQGTLTEVGDQSFYHCKLLFNPVTKIEAYKPYLFKVNRVNERIINEMYAAEGKDPCEVTEVADPVNAGISVCMQGTLEGYDMDASDGLSFYFGYDETNDAYNFYRVSARIPKNRCWFYISDNRAAGAKLQVVFDSEVNSINTQIADKSAKGNIYNVNGQLMGTQKSNLPKGLYIVNGKKMVIK